MNNHFAFANTYFLNSLKKAAAGIRKQTR